MKPRTAAETAVTTICATGLIAPALLLYGLHDLDIHGRAGQSGALPGGTRDRREPLTWDFRWSGTGSCVESALSAERTSATAAPLDRSHSKVISL